MKKEKKKKSGWRIFFLVLEILLLVVLIPAIVLTVMLIVKYRTTSYEYQKPVVREEEYVMPAYPEVVPIPEGMEPDELPADFLPAEEEAPETVVQPEQTPESEAQPAPSEQPQAEPEQPERTESIPAPSGETKEPEKTEPAASTEELTETVKGEEHSAPPAQSQTPAQTGEALPKTVNTPAQTDAVKYDTNASFANSPNAVSVYGNVPIYQAAQKNADIQNILVMGTDTRDVTMDRGRSDVMMVVSYNKKTGSVKLTSLLRDSLVPIEGHGWNRLNTAYFYGGVGLTVNTINQIYGLDIQEFIVIDFNGVKAFFDYIGGVDVYLTKAEIEYYGWKDMQEGVNHLNQSQALAHMRNRYLDSDFGRTRRQRDVITAVLKAVTKKSLTEIYDITDYSFSLIKTNISALSMAGLAASLLSNASNLSIETQNVPYYDAFQNAWYGDLGAVLSYDIGASASRMRSFIYQ